MKLNEQIALVELLSKRLVEDCRKLDDNPVKYGIAGRSLGEYAMKDRITGLRKELLILSEKVGERLHEA